MTDLPLDEQERHAVCDLLDALGPDAPTVIEGWNSADLTAHLLVRERDLLAGPCMVLPGPFHRFAERRMKRLAREREFGWLVDRLRSGPPRGFFRLGWVRSLANLNEFFVHHEDLRRANGFAPRDALPPALQAALWRNACRGGRYLCRRLGPFGLQLVWPGSDCQAVAVRTGEMTARLSGQPGELLLYLFGRRDCARVEVTGPAEAVAAVGRTHLGM
ncbi:TIGR03085 family protein [Mycobacterium sp. 852013-50091_SCH5140682]|uniref:TIGR03085 family metal-binding protein n=1 Tax=Mycobacterium sp. 852013-50091_SCH5140682 TaxID=1834109 RepID=UPI0007EB627B|nr:TIGR03085 family metal-binding protein [Mycobacterium sp. 852013-50091_SCH5140682]OBC06414.1 TIGR03085 family protein [Mycobacterium sp. 852013-50091_SCH5140682]